MKHKGSCHCGRIAFEAEGELEQVMDCNCSICSRRGSLLGRRRFVVPARRAL
ncbi:MAG: GFA family protein [Gammaproteobacteria bacterium]